MKNRKTQITLGLVIGALAVTLGCTHARVQTYLPSDGQLSCAELKQEIAKAESAIAEIDRKTGVSWRNAGLVVVSGVGLIMNEVNGSRERTSAEARIVHLNELTKKKSCQ